jgi:NAD(P)-dependent dehydrogenase (short-subunit alcohol dehydrogenase family)
MNISGASVLVTGGASGLGLATVRRLIDGAAQVVLVDLPSSQGEQVVADLGDAALFAPTDVTDADAVESAVDLAAGRGNGLRVVVNCAGIGAPSRVVGKNGPFPLDLFRRTIEVNLLGTFNVIRLAAARMSVQQPDGEDRGVIVNTASVAAFEGQIGQAAYSASKGGSSA